MPGVMVVYMTLPAKHHLKPPRMLTASRGHEAACMQDKEQPQVLCRTDALPIHARTLQCSAISLLSNLSGGSGRQFVHTARLLHAEATSEVHV